MAAGLLTPLAKSVLIPLGLSAANAAIKKKIYRSGHPSDFASHTTALIISNEEVEDSCSHIRKCINSKRCNKSK